MPYVPHTEDEVREMLAVIGVDSVEDLFAEITEDMRPQSFDLPEGLSEMEVLSKLEAMAAKNTINSVSFLGAGFYDHYIPAAVDALTMRGEFYTAYTPYQPEASQGTLQAIFEYQTGVTRLLGMEYANASVYDGGTALYEALMMAVRKTKRRKVIVSEALNPIYRVMLDSYTSNLDIEFVTVPHKDGLTDIPGLKAALDTDTAALLVQNPNFFGSINDFTELFAAAKAVKAVSIISSYPVLQTLLKTPGAMGADIAVAEGQSLGLPLSFGGPYLGIMTCNKEMIRQMPGRIVGRTEDSEGRTGYVLTLQAREQHIRRQKATSNICSNQSLCALRALVHMCALGELGLKRAARISVERAHICAERLTAIPGVKMLTKGAFGNEFAVILPVNAYEVIAKLTERGFVPGFPLGRYFDGLENGLLVACTEKTSEEQIGIFAEMLRGALK
ncbi:MULTISPECIES: aminomethyl-transferring glycine dehydrogenase subunit GcvPA [unclassified Pseudodesulfovibrio]|uniref:aminomethyl-transferring glycine dehydrogenase subunit GcvPA n=1 Tax=unclassified Pseudodesulfovibrio TaxID=2661612 RepID=UPI000FEBD63A|nr:MULTISPECIES: aminomethyl-transferring glycine dehydrogenase subunit GcvPA [unclassified Pseudodesulfovibrio]MCJ2163155.1 aminomethyl-transferring glycine dehydrogenase subunit GcvPA [Pseudodesulfovibrio sp. S3-i]RWU07145.1 aminomethyl-transferring glycine dehydrogenase subunit GcvPA [Pseudodesulfovibrio sp. S3]